MFLCNDGVSSSASGCITSVSVSVCPWLNKTFCLLRVSSEAGERIKEVSRRDAETTEREGFGRLRPLTIKKTDF